MKVPGAARQYDPRDQDTMRRAIENAVTTLEQRPNTSALGSDRGDTSVTLVAGTDVEIQRFATALTANRTVTLGQGFAGARFTITRSGLGAFTIDVGPGLKTLPSATAAWCDVGHDGTGWALVRFGNL